MILNALYHYYYSTVTKTIYAALNRDKFNPLCTVYIGDLL